MDNKKIMHKIELMKKSVQWDGHLLAPSLMDFKKIGERKNVHHFGDQRKQWKLIWMRRICGQCKVYDGRWLSGYIFIHSWARRCIYRYTRVYTGVHNVVGSLGLVAVNHRICPDHIVRPDR